MSTVSVTNVVSTTVQATEIKSNSATLPVMIENNAGVEIGWFARAWVNFNGSGTNGTQTINAAGNVSSVSRTATGRYNINFATPMPDVNYSYSGSSRAAGAGTTVNIIGQYGTDATPTTTNLAFTVETSASSPVDSAIINIQVFR